VCWAAQSSIVCRKDSVIAPLFTEPTRIRYLLLDETSAYYVVDSRLRRVTLATSAATTSDTGPAPTLISTIALDATHAYWISDGEIRRVAKTGGPPTVLATLSDTAADIAVDATHAYWTTQGGKVFRAPK
jgi:hypothetical protein